MLAASKYGPRSPQAIGSKYFKHFSRDFHRSYGLGCSEVELADVTMGKRLNSGSCYWLSDPAIAISTLAETFTENAKALPEIISALEELGGLGSVMESIRSLADIIGGLNTKANPDTPRKKQKKSLKKFAKLLRNNQQMATFKLMAILGACIYLPAIHVVVAEFCTSNMNWLRKNAAPSERNQPFKEFLKGQSTDALTMMKDCLNKELGISNPTTGSLLERLSTARKRPAQGE